MASINDKPDLVLHICCAPDEAWGIQALKEDYNLHCFFSNPNIDTEAEYKLRLVEAENVARHYNIPFSSDKYDPQSWEQCIGPYAHTPEGAERCRECFLLRFRRTVAYCKEAGYDSFSTVMSVSPHKSISMLNETGAEAASGSGVKYRSFDLKKKDGFRKSILLSKELGLYRQNYCGCRLSKKEREIREEKKKFPSPLPC